MAHTNSTQFPPEFNQALEKFGNHLYARCGMADSTVALMVGYIRRLAAQLGPHPSQDALDKLIGDMRRNKMSYGNITNAMKAIEHYMRFIGDPIKFKRPKKPVSPAVKVLSDGKIALMLAATKNLRERAILAVMVYTGMRNHELIDLRVRDVDIPQQGVTIQSGKFSRGRVCYMAGECTEILSDYLRERKGQPDDWLFVTVRHGHKLQTQDVRKFVRVVAKRAGVSGRVWPHLFRHSLATSLLDRGANLYSIQALLGHAFLTTTIQSYLHPSSRNVKADYHRCVPSYL